MSGGIEKGTWPTETLPKGWTWTDFDGFWTDYTDSRRKLPQKHYLPAGRFAVVDQGEGVVGGYSNDDSLVSQAPSPAIVFGDHTRAVKYIDFPFLQGADGVRVLSPNEGIDPTFAYAALRCIELPNKGYSRHFKFLKSSTFPVAPLPEQRRIVSKIHSLSGRSKRARDHLYHVSWLVEKYKQGILAAAFRGELTREWRARNSYTNSADDLIAWITQRRKQIIIEAGAETARQKGRPNSSASASRRYQEPPPASCEGPEILPDSWKWAPVELLATKVVDGVHKKPTYVEKGIPFITVKNLTAGRDINFQNVKYVSEEDHFEFSKRTNPERGDILITKDGTLGVVKAVRTNQTFSVFVSVALVKPVFYDMTDYLELAFQSPQVQSQMIGVGTGLQHIHLTDLRKDLIPLAPPEEQQEIVHRVRAAFSWIDRLAAEATSARKLIDYLDQAILSKAFRGELVPQDPNDEPASVLLERIRAEQAPASGNRRTRSRTSER
jgi:type I restriction enzyme S subunit